MHGWECVWILTCRQATLGGSTSPMLSPWTMVRTPMVLVVIPQEFWKASCFSPGFLGSSNTISNILEKFWPRWWDVAPWGDRRKWPICDTFLRLMNHQKMKSVYYLNGSATGRDERLHSSCIISSCKLFLLRLPPFHYRDRHQLFIHPGIQVKDLQHLHTQNPLSCSKAKLLYCVLSSSILYVIKYNSRAVRSVTSSAASSLVANAVCPSCHRNSLVLRKGWGCLNSHL